MVKVIIFADGASIGNPGPAAIGAVVKDEKGENLSTISKRIGNATNNQAEYHALLSALDEAVNLGADEVDIKLDSELVVRQLLGRYKVKAKALKPLYGRVKEQLVKFRSYRIAHISGERNVEAHRLAHRALKKSF